jgi:hypothetical protein
LPVWRGLFDEGMPGAEIILNPSKRAGTEADAQRLIASGELANYNLDELTTHNVWVLWSKPAVVGVGESRQSSVVSD